jgi:Zinc finger, C4 type (two domains)
VDVSRRNQCQACRFRRCLEMNMKREGQCQENLILIDFNWTKTRGNERATLIGSNHFGGKLDPTSKTCRIGLSGQWKGRVLGSTGRVFATLDDRLPEPVLAHLNLPSLPCRSCPLPIGSQHQPLLLHLRDQTSAGLSINKENESNAHLEQTWLIYILSCHNLYLSFERLMLIN